jgi:hypothetical protein
VLVWVIVTRPYGKDTLHAVCFVACLEKMMGVIFFRGVGCRVVFFSVGI